MSLNNYNEVAGINHLPPEILTQIIQTLYTQVKTKKHAILLRYTRKIRHGIVLSQHNICINGLIKKLSKVLAQLEVEKLVSVSIKFRDVAKFVLRPLNHGFDEEYIMFLFRLGTMCVFRAMHKYACRRTPWVYPSINYKMAMNEYIPRPPYAPVDMEIIYWEAFHRTRMIINDGRYDKTLGLQSRKVVHTWYLL